MANVTKGAEEYGIREAFIEGARAAVLTIALAGSVIVLKGMLRTAAETPQRHDRPMAEAVLPDSWDLRGPKPTGTLPRRT